MKIRTIYLMVMVWSFFSLFGVAVAVAGDCGGSYKTIPNYNKSRMGSPCKYLGLDSHRGTCQQGQAYETLCDDASGGRYKTCQGLRSCYATQQPQQLAPPATNQLPCTAWDYNYNQPCPAGFYNRDCRGGCER